ncbi:MarR family winged helix-turn-helix transcriptional regulator [Streptomyces sp. 4503]|uniref:MarR family winged helix-turn-helix transcriptional regulator n=1 Tax=Streptomyces niphimycinicus TaxID=2842201 RepID=A0ABS6CJB1_9ACTN|nr:MarR family winged helix-turn-helix transcriptional regulator [Streptomyces niphimycinicus]MBU3866924.1 MarR family winged helix-turn-helix transcriptional regulator [Streptomyces niphimycinicus]
MTSDQPPLQPLTPAEEAFVRELSRVMLALPRAVDADIMREARLPLSEYTPLMHLSEAPDRAMRMNELAAACCLSLSGMTRVVTRLEKQGWVERTKSAQDKRGWNAVLTDAGLARLEHAWPAFLTSVRRQLVDHFAGHDISGLTNALRHVATADLAPNRTPAANSTSGGRQG